MFVEKPKKGAVIGLRLVTGEEVLAKFVNFDKSNAVYLVKKPFTLVSDGSGGIGLAPASALADDTFVMEYNANVVVSKFTPKEEFIKTYEQVLSPVITPDSKIIT